MCARQQEQIGLGEKERAWREDRGGDKKKSEDLSYPVGNDEVSSALSMTVTRDMKT